MNKIKNITGLLVFLLFVALTSPLLLAMWIGRKWGEDY